jgi:hypothetical protein
VRLSERETAAFLALADHGVPVTGGGLGRFMGAGGRETSTAAAHQAGAALARKGLAIKGNPDRHGLIRYEITNDGRKLAAVVRSAP